MAVGTLLLLLTTSIIGQSSDISKRTTTGLLAASAAASAADLIASDLESLANTAPGTVLEMVPLTTITNFGKYGELFFLAIPGNDSAQTERGQVRAIAYRIVDRDPVRENGPNPTPGLYRTVITANSTFSGIIGVQELALAFQNTPPSMDDFLIGDVASLEVRFFNAGLGKGVNELDNSRAMDPAKKVRLTRNSSTVGGSTQTVPVRWIEVGLSVLENRDNVPQRLRQPSLSTTERDLLLESHTQRLARRVPIRQAL